jgi:hypothetical protein
MMQIVSPQLDCVFMLISPSSDSRMLMADVAISGANTTDFQLPDTGDKTDAFFKC